MKNQFLFSTVILKINKGKSVHLSIKNKILIRKLTFIYYYKISNIKFIYFGLFKVR